MPLAAMVVVAVVVGVLARPRLAAMPPAARAAVFLATAAVPAVGATIVLVPVAGAAGPARYLAPGLPAVALLAALVAVRTARALDRALRAGEARVGLALGALALVAAYRLLSAGADGTDGR